MLERQLKILMTDEKSFKDFKDKISNLNLINFIDELKRNRGKKLQQKPSAISPSRSPTHI